MQVLRKRGFVQAIHRCNQDKSLASRHRSGCRKRKHGFGRDFLRSNTSISELQRRNKGLRKIRSRRKSKRHIRGSQCGHNEFGTVDTSGRMGSRLCLRFHTEVRLSDELRRSICSILRLHGKLQAYDARQNNRYDCGRTRQQSFPSCIANQRTTHQERESNLQHLYGTSLGCHNGRTIRMLARTRGHKRDSGRHKQHRSNHSRSRRGLRIQTKERILFRYHSFDLPCCRRRSLSLGREERDELLVDRFRDNRNFNGRNNRLQGD